MIFYSSVSIILGVLLIYLGILYLCAPKTFLKNFNLKKYKDFKSFRILNGIGGVTIGVFLIVPGILSFIFKNDLIYSIYFAIIIFIYLLYSFILKRKYFIKETTTKKSVKK